MSETIRARGGLFVRNPTLMLAILLLYTATLACVNSPVGLETKLPTRSPSGPPRSDIPLFLVVSEALLDKEGEYMSGAIGIRYKLPVGHELAKGLALSLRLAFEEVSVRQDPPVLGDEPALFLEPQLVNFQIRGFTERADLVVTYRLIDNRGRLIREATISEHSSFGRLQLVNLVANPIFLKPSLRDSTSRALCDVYEQLLGQMEELQSAGLISRSALSAH